MFRHTNSHGVTFYGIQPEDTTFHANPDLVCMTFVDHHEADRGVQVAMSHAAFKDFMVGAAKLREQVEAYQEEDDQ